MNNFKLNLFATMIIIAGIETTGCFCKHIPQKQKLTDCTNSIIRFQMTVTNNPPYNFVLGMPRGTTNNLNFQGEIIISQATKTITEIPLNAQNLTPCNWLGSLDGYVLTWSRTNRADKLETFLISRQTYEVELRFSEPPPPTSSFWLESMDKTCL